MPEPRLQIVTDEAAFWEAKVERYRVGATSQNCIVELRRCGFSPDTLEPCQPLLASIYITDFEPRVDVDDVLIFKAQLSSLESHTFLPDELDYAALLKRQGVSVSGMVNTRQLIAVDTPQNFSTTCRQWRQRIIELLQDAPLQSSTRQFLITTITGEKEWLTSDLREIYSRSGLSHILALSGLHVGIVMLLIGWLLWPLRTFGQRSWWVVAIIVALWAYAALTGFSASVTRAVVMTSLWLLAGLWQRHYSPVNTLAAAAIIILVVAPEQLFSAGFQLSFLAVLAILLLARPLNPIDEHRWTLHRIGLAFTVPIAAMIGTGAVAAYHFHTFPVYFLLSNLATGLLLTPLLGGGFLVVALEGLGWQSAWACKAVDILYAILEWIARSVGSLEGALVTDIYFPAWWLIIYGAAILTALLWWHQRQRRYIAVSGCLASTLVLLAIFTPEEADGTESHLYIVGRGRFTEAIYGQGNRLSIDCRINTANPPSNPFAIKRMLHQEAEQRYAPYMSRRRIARLDSMKPSVDSLGVEYHPQAITLGGTTILLLGHHWDSDTMLWRYQDRHIPYLVVEQGFKDSLEIVVERFRPDTIVLGSSLNKKWRLAYGACCDSMGLPYFSLRDRCLHLSVPEEALSSH